ncbi:hypothetical protein [Ureibacillus endophyticus]|uniref:hypothetical protein n=1 Tax=Ureibacillus endophyticus TaxID=1978490 RepID=UPI00147340FF|nr:hypothetical protein [Lysinibacillus endophyticus]
MEDNTRVNRRKKEAEMKSKKLRTRGLAILRGAADLYRLVDTGYRILREYFSF